LNINSSPYKSPKNNTYKSTTPIYDDNSPMNLASSPSLQNTPSSAEFPCGLPSGVVKLEHLGIIRVAGADAAAFLQGQLTNDVALLGMNESRLAAFCSAKGRMQASFTIYKRSAIDATQTTPDIYMVCSHDILPQTLKRLSMFVMRAKAKLTDVTDEFSIFGLTGNTINLIATQAINTPATVIFNTSTVVALPPALGQSRALLTTPVGTPVGDAALAGDALSTELWNWGEVHAGIATITAPIVDAFVPQMLNFESVGGVNFKKGCYPGQEVVARSQFRGTLKRRAFVVQIDASSNDEHVQPFVSQEVFHESDAEQPCGMVVQVAKNPAHGSKTGFSAIVSMQVSAADGGKLSLGSAIGANITLLPLPYPLLEDI
jgi:tRNA-modifying protein YgfZ